MNKKIKNVTRKHRKKRARTKARIKELKANSTEKIEKDDITKDSAKTPVINKSEAKA